MRTSLLCRLLKTMPLLVIPLFLMQGLAQAKQPPPPPKVYQPEIAYASNQGATYSIYVANADGTNAVAVYSNKGFGTGSVTFVPGSGNGSGQLVFYELYSVKLLTFTVTASGITTNSVVTLVTEPTLIHYVDVSPPSATGQQFVLYGLSQPDNMTTIKVIPIAGGQPTSVATGDLGDAVWSHDLTRIAVLVGNPNVAGVTQQIEMLDLDSSFVAGTATVIYTRSCDGCLNNLQFARTTDNVIFDGGLGFIYEIDADLASSSAVTPFAVSGWQACFNHDDTKIIFRRFSDSHLFVYDIGTMTQTAVSPSYGTSPDFRAWSP